MYVLIVASFFGGSVAGYSITTQEFATKQACEYAERVIEAMTKDARHNSKTACLSKG